MGCAGRRSRPAGLCRSASPHAVPSRPPDPKSEIAELAQGSHLKAVLPHHTRYCLVIDDQALGVKPAGDASIAVAWELSTQRLNAVAQNLFLRRTAAVAVIVSR